MAAYVIVRVDISDTEKYKQYTAKSPDIIRKYEGKFIVRGGETITLEGQEDKRRIVVIEFPSVEKAKEFYYSPEYTEARALRNDAAIGEMIVTEGI